MRLVVASVTNRKNYFRNADGDCYISSNYIVLTQVFLKTSFRIKFAVLFQIKDIEKQQ